MDTGEAPDFDSFSETDWENYYAEYEAVTQMPEFADVFDVLAKLKKIMKFCGCISVIWMKRQAKRCTSLMQMILKMPVIREPVMILKTIIWN